MNDTSQQVEAGRLGGLAKQRNERNLLAKLKAERPVLDAEVALLRSQKTALIAFAKGKGATNDEIVDVLAPSHGEVV